ncbi:tetratricopeptide repeat protein [Methylonatrum kenyense]|uniref:tetratricopeptide repeat protein n=1 Tax=Methylonatrum kenyense TaxID=455253 RepID=UPI003D0C2FD4
MDQSGEALDWYEKVEGDNFVAASVRRAILLGDMGRVAAARDEVRQLREEFPEEAVRSYLIEGEVLRRNEEFDAARDLYNEAIGRHPGNVDLLYGRALIAVYRGDVETAERDLRRVLEDEPDNANALNALGYTLVDLTDRYEEGFDLVRRAHALEPENAAILDSMGWAHFRLGNYEEALDYLERAFERMPDAEVAAHLGEVLWTMDRRDEAREIWRRGEELDAEHRTLRETLERLDP